MTNIIEFKIVETGSSIYMKIVNMFQVDLGYFIVHSVIYKSYMTYIRCKKLLDLQGFWNIQFLQWLA
jgi:hypothetical protein